LAPVGELIAPVEGLTSEGGSFGTYYFTVGLL